MADPVEVVISRLVVGLGNPGREYDNTRHNVGFAVLDLLAQRAGVSFESAPRWKARVARTDSVHLLKPLTFMNLSGESVGAALRFHKWTPSQVLIVLDDTALPPGRLRLRITGSSGGHNGLQSVIDHLGTRDVPRLRIGVGNASPGEMVGHVLGRFTRAELEEIAPATVCAAELIEHSLKIGLAAAMNLINKDRLPKS